MSTLDDHLRLLQAHWLADNVFKIERMLYKIETLFDKIKHGDAEHQEWLKKAIEDHFKYIS